MANVNVKFNDKNYLLSCDDGQEENLQELASHLNTKFAELKKNLGNIGENKLLLITTIKIIDEFFDLKKKITNTKDEFESLSKKFKEIKALAINYKDEKEEEIDKLKNELNEFKKLAEESQNLYEQMLDKTTKSIQDFIENTESQKNLQ